MYDIFAEINEITNTFFDKAEADIKRVKIALGMEVEDNE